MFFQLQNADLLVCSDHKPLFKIFAGPTDNDKCNICGIEATTVPRYVKVQHFKEIASVLADSLSRLRAVGLYHDLDFNDHQQEFSALFELLPPVEPATHTPLEVNEIFIASNIEKLTQNYDAIYNLPTAETDEPKLSLENISPTDIP